MTRLKPTPTMVPAQLQPRFKTSTTKNLNTQFLEAKSYLAYTGVLRVSVFEIHCKTLGMVEGIERF